MWTESLSAASIANNLETRFIGQRVLYYPVLTSTMDIARQEAVKRIAEGTIVVAEEQTAGRGRLKRSWLSPTGSIAVSVILYPAKDHLSSLMMLASLAVARAIRGVTGIQPQIKWPNDVLINGKKVCGILIETDVQADRVNYAVLGIGVNINFKVTGFPELQSIATSLSDELGRDISRLNVLRRMLTEMEILYLTLSSGGSIYEEWRDNLVTLGRAVRVKTGDAVCEGIAESVDRDGSLLLRASDGNLTKIIAGDVTLRAD